VSVSELHPPHVEAPAATERQRWLGVLARSAPADVAAAWEKLGLTPEHDVLRAPETGLVMVRGRAGGTGAEFNLGEMTVTRAVIRIRGGAVGVGYVAGRDKDHAVTTALADALLQDPECAARVHRQMIEPLMQSLADARILASRKAAATRVDFFTMVRDREPG
jgi:alpha-D-ribose 1-methylphosphonate 5-triphosphate synthase subunit PhnG